MTFSGLSNHDAKPRSGENVAAWKEHVQFFFKNDWSRLRAVMLELEEGSWNKGVAEPVISQEELAKIQELSLPSFSTSGIPKHEGTTGGEQQTPATDRLSQLAEQIERKLRTASTIGR
jgi:hypothetical protein